MTRIYGYAKQKEPKWINFLLWAAIIVGVVIAIFVVAVIANWMEGVGQKWPEVKELKIPAVAVIITLEARKTEVMTGESGDILVEKIVVTSKVDESNLPTDALDNFPLKDHPTVNCYTRINSPVIPTTIRHVWVDPAGAVLADIKLNIVNRPADTWSYKTLYGTKPGRWEVQVRKENDEIIARREFSTY